MPTQRSLEDQASLIAACADLMGVPVRRVDVRQPGEEPSQVLFAMVNELGFYNPFTSDVQAHAILRKFNLNIVQSEDTISVAGPYSMNVTVERASYVANGEDALNSAITLWGFCAFNAAKGQDNETQC